MLSLIIPVRDWPADRLDACVESFLRLASSTLDEIIVVDFGSTVPVERLDDNKVRVVRIEAGSWNPAGAANAGVAASRNPVVAKVNADIVIAAESGPGLDVAVDSCGQTGGMVLVRAIDLPENVDTKAALALPTTELARRGRLASGRGFSGLGVFTVETWDEVGGFDPRLDGQGDADVDFATRVRQSGHKLRWAPTNKVCVFRVGQASHHTTETIGDPFTPTQVLPSQDQSVLRSFKIPPAAQVNPVQSPNIVNRPRPLVTVAIASIPRRGRNWMLAGAIRGFAGQIDNDFEILIGNRGSVEELDSELRRPMGARGTVPPIRIVDVGAGPVASMHNRLTEEARGRYICLADDDALPLPSRLADHLRCFEKERGIHGSHGGWINVDQLNQVIDLDPGGGLTLEALLFAPGKIVAHAASLYRRDVMRAVRYDEACPAECVHDLALRMANMGCRISHTGSFVTLRRFRSDATAAKSLTHQQTASQYETQRVRESLGSRHEQRLGEQAKASAPAVCSNPLTSEQVSDLIIGCSGLEKKPGETAAFKVARHTKDRPLVSIIIPCFNYGRFVGEAVASAKAQTFENIEIIVVDGGSTDGLTRRIVAGLEGKGVRTFLRKGRHRAGDNRNFGIGHARGKYVCCLDADDMLAPTYVEKAVFLMEHYGYDVVSAAVQKFDQETTRYGVAEKVDLQVLLDRNQMATCGVFRKTLWKASGGYRDLGDGSAGTHVHEDWEFWVRLAAHGARFFNIEHDHLFHYRIHATASISRRDGVKPLEWQRQRIRELNSGLITDETIERSLALRHIARKARDPLINVAPGDGTAAAKSVIVALPWMVLGGAERLLSRILKHLADDGWDVSILTTLAPNVVDGDSHEWFAPATSRIYHLPKFLSPERWEDFVDYLIASRRATRLLVAGSAYTYEQLPRLKSKYPDLKIFDLLFNATGHTSNNRRFAECIDGNIVENSEVRDWLLDHGETRDRIATIPSGVTLPKARVQVDRSFRKSLGMKPGDVVVGFCGRWSPEKNPIGFIEIAERLAKNHRVHFVMTGAGQLADEVSRRVAAAVDLAARFHLLGNVPNLASILASLDILVLPSIVDGRPVVILEALAAGVPVIASNVGGVPELILPGTNGELCPPGDVAAFADAITALAADRERLQRYKTGARAFAESNLDEQRMLERYVEVLGAGRCADFDPVTAPIGVRDLRIAKQRPKKHAGPIPVTVINAGFRSSQRVRHEA